MTIGIIGYMDPAVEGTTVSFVCPPQYVLNGPNTTTCTGCRVLDQVQPILPYIIYSARDHMNRHRDACTTSSD